MLTSIRLPEVQCEESDSFMTHAQVLYVTVTVRSVGVITPTANG
jgi:hypothetical protein